ncbi:hypothetical protein, partial [Hydrogenimonas sp.]
MITNHFIKHLFFLLFASSIAISVQAGVAGKPDLKTTMSDSPDPVEAGKEITYSVNISNISSDTTAKNVHVTFSSGVTFVSGSGWSCSSSTTCSYAVYLGPNQSASQLKVKRTAPTSGNSTSLTVTAASAVEDGDPSNNSATATTTVEAPKKPKLSASKTASPSTANPNEAVSFTIKVKNDGDGTATAVTLKDTIPSGFTITSYDSRCSKSGQTISCNLGDIGGGGNKSVTIQTTAPSSPGNYYNSATANASNASQTTSNSVKVHVRGADVYFYRAYATTVASGEKTTLFFQVKNQGDLAANSVKMEYTLPSGFKNFKEVSDPKGQCSVSGDKLTCNFGTLAANATSSEIKVSATAPEVSSSNTYYKQATISTSSVQTNTGNDTKNVGIPVRAVDLDISKSADPSAVESGGETTFTISVTNETGAWISGVTIEDKLADGGFTYVSVSSDKATCSGGSTVKCTLSSLGDGESETVTIKAKAPTSTGNYTNEATTTSTHAARSWSDDATVEVQGVDLKAKLVCTPYVAMGGNYNCRLFIEEKNVPDITDATLSFTFPEGTRSFFRTTIIKDDRFSCTHSDGSGTVTCTLKSGKTISQADGAVKVASVRLRAFDESLFDVTDFYKNGILHELDIS